MFGGEDVTGNVLNPSIRSQLNGTNQCVRDEENEKKQRSNRGLGDVGNTRDRSNANHPADPAREARRENTACEIDEHADKKTDNKSTEDTHVFHHFTEAESLLGRLRLRHLLTHEHDAVNESRDEEQSELDLPVKITHGPTNQATENEAERPAGVKDVEIVGSIIREERRDKRVGDRLKHTVRNREGERPPEKELESGVLRLSADGAEGDEGGKDVKKERGKNQLPVTKFIDDQTTENNSRAKTE